MSGRSEIKLTLQELLDRFKSHLNRGTQPTWQETQAMVEKLEELVDKEEPSVPVSGAV